MICYKGNHKIVNGKWESGKTYEGLDRHHNPPEFMFRKNEKWFGEMIGLCRKHHNELHKEIRMILWKNSNSIQFINSDDWLMKYMSDNQVEKARHEIYIFTNKWGKKEDDNSKTTN